MFKIVVELLGWFEVDGQCFQLLEIIYCQFGLLEWFVEDFVDLVCVGVGKLMLVYCSVEFQQLLGVVLQSCCGCVEVYGVNLGVLLLEVFICVEVDDDWLYQVVVNLFNNVIKFMLLGGLVVLLVNVDMIYFVVQVKDIGVGIGLGLLLCIFDMFIQVDGVGLQCGVGLGVGFVLVKQIVFLYQGMVEVRSEGLGKGSEFIVCILLVLVLFVLFVGFGV